MLFGRIRVKTVTHWHYDPVNQAVKMDTLYNYVKEMSLNSETVLVRYTKGPVSVLRNKQMFTQTIRSYMNRMSVLTQGKCNKRFWLKDVDLRTNTKHKSLPIL